MVALFCITKGECVMEDVTLNDLEDRNFKNLGLITKPKETDKNGIK